MLLAAAQAHQLDLSACWMIGDSEIDVEAGRSARCRTVRLLRSNETGKSNADVVAYSLLEAIPKILRQNLLIAQNRAMATKEA
jgi:D-glycero-D-manno-heptose 1,7-bisphosphate phosphatase